MCRCVAFERAGALGKQGGTTDEQFRPLKNHCQGFKKKSGFIKNLVKVRLNTV